MKKSEKATRSILRKTVKHYNSLRCSQRENDLYNEKGSIAVLRKKISNIIKTVGCTKEVEKLAAIENSLIKESRSKRNNFEEISDLAYFNDLYY